MYKHHIMKLTPDMNYNVDTNVLTVLTVFCYVLFVITLQSVAAIMTIVAATTTAVWNIYKIITDKRERDRARRGNSNGSKHNKSIEQLKSTEE